MLFFPKAGLPAAALAVVLLAVPSGGTAQESLADLPDFREGCQALADERFETAVRHFDACWKVIEQSESGDAEENFVAGRLLESLVRGGATSTAIEWVRDHPLLRPSPETSRWIALAFQKEERFDEAADYYNLYLSAVPDAGNTANLNRAICLALSGKAEAAFELVHGLVTPASPAERMRLAQIATAAARYVEALDYLAEIAPADAGTAALRFPLGQLRTTIQVRTGQRAAAFATVYELIDTAPDAAEARLAFLLLEQLIDDARPPADLPDRIAAWETRVDFAGREAAALFRPLLLPGSDDLHETLQTLAKRLSHPDLREECRLRLAELASRPAGNGAGAAAAEIAAGSLAPDILNRLDFADARATYRTRAFADAARRFIEIADSRIGEERSRNLYNAAVSALQNDDGSAFAAYEEALSRNNPRSLFLADLSYLGGLYFAAKGDPLAFERLNTFTRENPDHPANVEAQLALAEIHLNQAPARPQAAREIFDGLRIRPLTLTQSERLDYTSIWVELTDSNAPELVRRAGEFIKDWPSSAYLPEVIMLLASQHYQLKNHGAAGEYFALVANRFPDSPYADTARFFDAASSPSSEETIKKWRNLIAADGAFTAEARHELGLLYLSIDRFAEARAEFEWLIGNLPADHTLRFAAMADLGFASYLEALAEDKDPAKLEEAANVFAALSGNAAAPAFWRYNAAVRRGKCLEALGRDSIALEIYRSIVDERKPDPSVPEGGLPLQETEWVFRAGFAAIDILTAEKNWAGAIHVADALSDKSGPRAIEATRLAERLRLKHWVWD
jgi:TolA-binding protein